MKTALLIVSAIAGIGAMLLGRKSDTLSLYEYGDGALQLKTGSDFGKLTPHCTMNMTGPDVHFETKEVNPQCIPE